ncbi:amino acid permease [Methylocapsa palsarum]|uniref:Diguanylate cyclase (GGDEF) domain-containing protein n=1 Tax=Methylocapsa palsarum TaxID=1612308 RepID=A0A1I4C2W4_9HYPH|nr:amino acid permease [Methylocapsa palsarum]SFK74536.1 diguanylate cyclase (GGDEF) domain-containing protein [Methylocapsa palsarum]
MSDSRARDIRPSGVDNSGVQSGPTQESLTQAVSTWFDSGRRSHPRTIGWRGAAALAMGGSNQMIFIITALFAGQGDILGKGSAAVPLLIVGVILSWVAAPAWTELVLMWPNRVGGISAACAEAFRPYSPVLSTLTGTCYWWGWVPTCGVTAILSASAIQQWYLPRLPVEAGAAGIVLAFTILNLCGLKWVTRFAMPLALASGSLAFLSSIIPVWSGLVDWRQATTFTLTTPFPGWFGDVTSVMAGLYLIGFAAPAFEAAACHVGEMVDPDRNLPLAMLVSAAMAGVYFVILPVVWLGVLGSEQLGKDLALVLGPTFAPLLGSFGKAAAIWFVVLNMFHGTMQPLAGAARTLSQLSEDGLLPRFLAFRTQTDCPWAATLLTAGMAIVFLLIGDPIWLIAAANFTYLIGICMPNVAAWLLRRDLPDAGRPYRAPRCMIDLGLAAAAVWLLSAILGFQQFGLPTVLFGLALAYSGAALYAWRMIEDRLRAGLPAFARTLHTKLTGAMLFVLILDGFGYIFAVSSLSAGHPALIAALEDIFVIVALLTITVGLVLPGMITHTATDVRDAATRLTSGMLRDFSEAMSALGRGDLDAAHVAVNIVPVQNLSHDELGEMGESFNILQERIREAAIGLDEARDKMHTSRAELLARREQITYLGHYDVLTNLPNRAVFAMRLADVFENAKAKGAAFGLLTLDLDHFKEVNDVFGHTVADELLCAIAARLQETSRGAFITRMGSDEFALLVTSGRQPGASEAMANELLKSMAQDFEIQGNRIPVGVSIGVATYPRDAVDPETLQANATAALYRAKADGRRMACYFDPRMDHRARERYSLQLDLRAGIPNEELRVYYQPLATIEGEVFGFEALVRWQHPKYGLLAPETFISTAEQNGLIIEIGEWVLRQACREAALWANPLQISVNLSPVQFRNGDFPDFLQSVLSNTGLAPQRLELEITEGVLINDTSRALSILRRLKSLKVKVAMDDFGTGFSSLSSLQSFPFDKIKIDRSFVAGVDSNPQSAAIVRAVIALGNGLDIPVIAEGVETESEHDFLKREGCREVQGYLIGRPKPIASYSGLTQAAHVLNAANVH